VQAPIYFLLQVKCDLVGRDLASAREHCVTKRENKGLAF
jgi:uncharacterized protein with ATP-grasp and redox domains